MSPEILKLDRNPDCSDEEIVALIAEVVGSQITATEFAQIGERLSGEDYTISERFFPALGFLYEIVTTQDDETARIKMTLSLATLMRYAVWEMIPLTSDSSVLSALQKCSQLFTKTCFLVEDVDDRRYLLMGVAAALGDADAAKLVHDLGSGYLEV